MLIEVAIAFAFLEGALWSKGISQLVWALITLAWVGYFTWHAPRNAERLGIGKHGLLRSLWIIPATIAVCGILMTCGYFFGSLHNLAGQRPPLVHAFGYATWALVQEFLTLSFIFVRFEDVFGDRIAILCTGVLFCIAHIPNLTLMLLTLPMSLAVCWLFRRFRNIYPFAVAHALLGLTISVSFTPALTHSMRVGISYFRSLPFD